MKSFTDSAEDPLYERYKCSSPGPVSTSPGLPYNVLLDCDDQNVRLGCDGIAERIKAEFERSCQTRVYDSARRWIASADASKKESADRLFERLRLVLKTEGRS